MMITPFYYRFYICVQIFMRIEPLIKIKLLCISGTIEGIRAFFQRTYVEWSRVHVHLLMLKSEVYLLHKKPQVVSKVLLWWTIRVKDVRVE